MLNLFLVLFPALLSGYDIVLFNNCPLLNPLVIKYGPTPNLTHTAWIYFSQPVRGSISYESVSYQLLDNSNNVITTKDLVIVNQNLNAIGYNYYQRVGEDGTTIFYCEPYEYSPTNSSLSSQSVTVYISGATIDETAYVGNTPQGIVPSLSNSFLQIVNQSKTVYSNVAIKFCNPVCASTLTGSATVPTGSGLFFIHTASSYTGSVYAIATGSTSLSCSDCWGPYPLWDDDWDIDVGLSDGVIAGIVIGCVGVVIFCCCICYLGYGTAKGKIKFGKDAIEEQQQKQMVQVPLIIEVENSQFPL